ncbi:histidine--tRNA ligase [Algiphilus aromaticivorans]|uniref:histidine--tRNA ligase n=1 Tax=Algiphilus aromaticivorans TaxID=382454 RepID=UPI00069390B2|nr:histidine--tRNA ligase [Algiphilus aromaticivorans]
MRLQSLRGFRDILPDEAARWQRILDAARAAAEAYGYRQIHLPLVEATELFKRSVGEATDIVAKEMFSFRDRDKTDMSLRPEGTASCVRAGIEHGLLHNQQQRLWYSGPMFRHERPQAGRYRQFHQFGVEAFGMADPACDIEVIAMSAAIWRALGLEGLTLELNTLGSPECRTRYREQLRDFLREHIDALDADARERVETNPLRVLDSKHPDTRAVVADAPRMADSLSAEARAHFEAVCAGLDGLGIAWTHNSNLVRGLDYYTHTVFEWTTDQLGAQGTVCAGGRYDGLVEQLGGGEVAAVGFAMGIERLALLLEQAELPVADSAPQVYLCWQGDDCLPAAQRIGERLRAAGLRTVVNAGGGSFKAQFKRADRSGADWALVLGPDELASDTLQLKSLRQREPQRTLTVDEALAQLGADVAIDPIAV